MVLMSMKRWMPVVVGLVAALVCWPVVWQVIQQGESLGQQNARFTEMARLPVVTEAVAGARSPRARGKDGVFLTVHRDGVRQVYIDADGMLGSIELTSGEMLLPHPDAGKNERWFGAGVLAAVFVASVLVARGVVWGVERFVQPRL